MEHTRGWKVRPKRKITKPCLDYSQVLLREEEQALKKALYVSLRDTKSEPDASAASKKDLLNASEDLPEGSKSVDQDECLNVDNQGITDKETVPRKRKRRRRNAPEKKARKELFLSKPDSIDGVNEREGNFPDQDQRKLIKKIRERLKVNRNDQEIDRSSKHLKNLSQDSRNIDETSQDTDTERSRKCLQAQRKFAQSQPCSPNSLLIQQMGLAVPERPKTEDFIKFLCLRGTPNLPKELEYLNNPLVPSSPLSSDEDEFLPVSPFFKRQISSNPSKLNKQGPSTPSKVQLNENSYNEITPNLEERPVKNLSGLFDEADINNRKPESNGVASNEQAEIGGASCKEDKSDVDMDKVVDKEGNSTEGCQGSASGSLNTRLSDVSPRKETEITSPETLRSERKDFSVEIREAKRLIDLSDSSSQESASEKKSRKKELNNDNDSNKGKRFRKKRNKEMEPNCYENKLNNAPIFRPMEQEFKDPVKYIKKIIPFVLKFGICVIVPPAGWQASTNISDDVRFSTKVQHIHKMGNRNSESATHLKYLRRCLGEKSDLLHNVPQIGSCEIDLQQMSKVFASVGGVAKVNTPRKWQKIADTLHLPKNAQGRINKLQDFYYKYVLPFDILSEEEKEKIKCKVHKEAIEKQIDNQAENPEFKGKSTSVSVFHRIASNAQEMYAKGKTSVCQIENDFWDIVEKGDRHVAAVSGDIDASNLESSSHSSKSKSGWNLSTLPHVQGSVLKYLGIVPGLTTSSLRFSSVFSCTGWQKNADDLFTIEYLHTGAKKVWYAVPSFYEQSFKDQKNEQREGSLLNSPLAFSCPVTRTVQNEGQFVVCLPKVYHSTLSSGYCLSESCYLAPVEWFAERFSADSNQITPSVNFPVEKIILNFAKCEIDKLKRVELVSLLSDMIKEIRRSYAESKNCLLKAGIENMEHINQGKQKRVNSSWEECSVCSKPCFPIMIQEGRKYFCTNHAVERLKEDKADPSSLTVKTHWDEDELESLVSNTEACLKTLQETNQEN